MKKETSDRMNIQKWAKNRAEELKEEIRYHIKEGIAKDKAVEMVLEESCIGTGYKAQIKFEFK